MKSWIILNIACGIKAGFNLKCAVDETEKKCLHRISLGTYLLDTPTEGSEDPRVLLHSIIIRDSANEYFRAALNLCESPLKET